MKDQKKRIHPHKFTLWLGLGSIVMMFAGLTSAYIVKYSQANWQGFDLPRVFWYSTIVILLSSVAIQLAVKAFKNREMSKYRQLIALTAILGAIFIALQLAGFRELNAKGIKMIGQGSNVAGSFLGVITGLHMLHVLGGVIVLVVILLKAFSNKVKNYSVIPIEISAIYWHFVDGLWVYLFLFLNWVR